MSALSPHSGGAATARSTGAGLAKPHGWTCRDSRLLGSQPGGAGLPGRGSPWLPLRSSSGAQEGGHSAPLLWDVSTLTFGLQAFTRPGQTPTLLNWGDHHGHGRALAPLALPPAPKFHSGTHRGWGCLRDSLAKAGAAGWTVRWRDRTYTKSPPGDPTLLPWAVSSPGCFSSHVWILGAPRPRQLPSGRGRNCPDSGNRGR